MTFIAVRCPHCDSEQIVKRGKTCRGTQRYLCQNNGFCRKCAFSRVLASVSQCIADTRLSDFTPNIEFCDRIRLCADWWVLGGLRALAQRPLTPSHRCVLSRESPRRADRMTYAR